MAILDQTRAVALRRASGYAAALLSIALVSAAIAVVDIAWELPPNVSMLYLAAVVTVAVRYGRGPAGLASAAAFLAFDWLFVAPRYTLTVSDPAEWVSLLMLLFVGLITGTLAARERSRAEEAREREREAVVLYDVVRALSEPDLERGLQAAADRMREELGLEAVSIEVGDGDRVEIRAVAGDVGAQSFRPPAGLATRAGLRPAAGRRGPRVITPHPRSWAAIGGRERMRVIPVSAPRGGRAGDLLLVLPRGDHRFDAFEERLLGAVAAQLGNAIERARLRREATEAEVLRRADELKTALLNAVSHDLRTPLASIIAAAGSLRQTDIELTDQERQEFALAIESEAQRLNGIVGNLLDLSRIEDGTLQPEKGWYDLAALIDDVLGRLRPATARHTVEVDVVGELPPVHLDYVELDQVLSNLVENATKYTPRGTTMRVGARVSGGDVLVEVADDGPGIPPASLPRLFERFYRADGGGPRPRGTGLGLAVAEGIVQAHGGRIWAENRPEGGARFAFTLPLEDAPARVERAAESAVT